MLIGKTTAACRHCGAAHQCDGPAGKGGRAARSRVLDDVLERAAGAASPAFQRYLSVLIAPS